MTRTAPSAGSAQSARAPGCAGPAPPPSARCGIFRAPRPRPFIEPYLHLNAPIGPRAPGPLAAPPCSQWERRALCSPAARREQLAGRGRRARTPLGLRATPQGRQARGGDPGSGGSGCAFHPHPEQHPEVSRAPSRRSRSPPRPRPSTSGFAKGLPGGALCAAALGPAPGGEAGQSAVSGLEGPRAWPGAAAEPRGSGSPRRTGDGRGTWPPGVPCGSCVWTPHPPPHSRAGLLVGRGSRARRLHAPLLRS